MKYMDVTRKNLIDAFWELYKQKNIRDISIKEVTDLAGYHRSTFYRHFSGLHEILEEIEAPLLPSSPDYYSRTVEDPMQAIPNLIKNYLLNAEYLHVLFGPNGDPAFSSKYLQTGKTLMKNRYAGQLTTKGAEFDLITEFMFAGCFALLNKWYGAFQEELDHDTVLKILHTIYTDGFLAGIFGKREINFG